MRTGYGRRAKRRFVDDPEPWLRAVGALENASAGIQPTANDTVEANLRLVHWKSRGHPRHTDAFQEAAIGLMRAFEKYDPSQGAGFVHYALYWINHHVMRTPDDRYPFHVPEFVKQIAWGFRRRKNPTPWTTPDTDLAQHYRTTEETIGQARALVQAVFLPIHGLASVQERVPEDPSLTRDEWAERHDALADDAPTPEENAMAIEAAETVRQLFLVLSPREARVIRLRFGFDGDDESLGQIGESLEMCRESIRLIEKKALEKLRNAAKPMGTRDNPTQVLKKRLSAIDRRSRLIAALLPRMTARVLDDRREELSREHAMLDFEREALVRAVTSRRT